LFAIFGDAADRLFIAGELGLTGFIFSNNIEMKGEKDEKNRNNLAGDALPGN